MASTAGRVVLTGANGFVSSHILSGLVDSNYHIIATVRTKEKGQQILDTHPSWKEHITFVYVPDMTQSGAYDEALKLGDVDYIIHTASPVTFAVNDFQKDLIDPAVNGTLRVLEAAQAFGGAKLKRVVLLSSGVSIRDAFRGNSKAAKGRPYTEADWNPMTANDAIKSGNPISGYSVSKTYAEKAAWDYVAQQGSSFELTVLNPVIIAGPMLHPIYGPENINLTNIFPIYSFFNGQTTSVEGVAWEFYHFVDVRDVARAHILALTNPAAANKRIALSAGAISPQRVVREVARQFPQLKERLADKGEVTGDFPPDVDPTDFDSSRSREVFGEGFKYRDFETVIGDTVRDLLAWERKFESK